MSKTVKVASSRWNEARTYTTDATTWGELKEELGSQVLNFEGSPMKTILRGEDGTRNVLVDNNTLLPQGDFALILVPEKVKSGDKIVYNSSVLKDMKTKTVKIFDFLIDAVERGGELVFDEDILGDVDEELLNVPVEEDDVDELIALAREIENEG